MLLCLSLFCLAGCGPWEDKSLKTSGMRPGVLNKVMGGDRYYQHLLYLPEDYGKKKREWPLMMFLHGVGNRGTNINKVKTSGVPKVVARDKEFDFILIAPQGHEDEWWQVDHLIELLDEIVSKYSVDRNRVYLTGLSMGGYGAWKLACEHPERFAAVVPICGGGPVEKACRLKHVPIRAFQGAKDDVVPLEKTQEMVNAVNACGGNAKLTVYPDLKHDSWSVTYDNKELYEWLLKHRISDRVKK
jgi:predicted peptidase